MLLVLAATLLAAQAQARVLTRCGLARELAALGVREHLATWVCIAYHESRLDTAARNPHSGDHGLLQISELYWCGPGRVCSASCDAFRDDELADDVACALRIHEEHTRLQGDGFLAWVVYPRYCRHNAKKYLADCDAPPAAPANSSRLHGPRLLEPARQDIDALQPPYLSVKSLVGNNYNSIFGPDRRDWTKFKLDNIDELKLPVFTNKPPARVEAPARVQPPAQPPTTAEPPAPVPTSPARTEPPAREAPQPTPPRATVQPPAQAQAAARAHVRNQITDDDIRKTTSRPSSYANKPKINHESTSFTSVGTTKTDEVVTSRPAPRTYKPFVFTTSPRWSTEAPRATPARAPPAWSALTTTTTPRPASTPPRPPPPPPPRVPETTTELNIFDFYLRQGTRRPPLRTYSFAPPRARLSIFAGGTTPPPAPARAPAQGGAARNYVRRQIGDDVAS
ncbi:altered inheritance of mitochondria protein 3-like [Plutella xylostella]|uniref:altered inheritance of mitochondria protein 3-like n=1 Tax=Plutella xylostella TaxID=51655 RepID=UPI002033101D|nr:altered inheritance of mitochondria protein 3-like [Plutella xylostella]